MDVDAKGYEEKPWWPYVLDLQQKIDAGGGGGTTLSFSLTNETGTNMTIATLAGENGGDGIDRNAFQAWNVNSGAVTILLPTIDGKVKMTLPPTFRNSYALTTDTPDAMYLEGPSNQVLVVTQSGVSGTVKLV